LTLPLSDDPSGGSSGNIYPKPRSHPCGLSAVLIRQQPYAKKESKIEKGSMIKEQMRAPGGKPGDTRPDKAVVFPGPGQKEPRFPFDSRV